MKKKVRIIWMLLVVLGLAGISRATDYYVSPSGSDSSDGLSLSSAFRTIQHAADQMAAGDACLIASGTYREQVIPKPNGPFYFSALPGHSVEVTGLDVVSPASWQQVQGNLFQYASADTVSQVFLDGEPQSIARFPNNISTDWLTRTLADVDSAFANANGPSTISDADLNRKDFTGAMIWILSGKKWVSLSSEILSHTGDTVSFEIINQDKKPYMLVEGNVYFIYGLPQLIDSAGEWFYDKSGNMLQMELPADYGSQVCEVRTRYWGFDLSGCDQVSVSNINLRAAGLNMGNATDCRFSHGEITYPVPFYAACGWGETDNPQNGHGVGVLLTGDSNLIEQSSVAYSWGDGITIGGTNHVVQHCVVHDVAANATDAAGIHASGHGHSFLHNTIVRCGRSGLVHRKCTALDIGYNDIAHCGVLTEDLGATYCFQTDGEGTRIHHNWVHDCGGEGWDMGIYLDNGSSNFVVDHNVVWNVDDRGIQTNFDAHNHQIYNNTIWNSEIAMSGSGGNGIMENQRVYNNLANAEGWLGTDLGHNRSDARSKYFVDPANGDFRLKSDAAARNRGIVVKGITDDVVDGKVDIGAYEFGGTNANWVPGANPTPFN